MPNKLKNVLIGVFVIASLVIAVLLIIFLDPSVGDGKKVLHVRFSNISGINDGTRVTFAGRPVGEVTHISEVKNARDERTDPLGRVYFYQLTLKIDSRVEIYNTDEITVQTTGLMGEKTVAIIPKAASKGVIPKPVTNQVLYANAIDPVENALTQISMVSKKVQSAVDNLNQWFVENREELSDAVAGFAATMTELDKVLLSVNKEKLICATTEAVNVLKNDLDLVYQMLDEAKDSNLVDKISVALENFAQASEAFNIDGKQVLSNLRVISQDVVDGSGTLGKLIVSDDLYLWSTSIMSKANTLMNDLNHYGLLFQYDKGWQRTRTKRANLLDALDTPRGFCNYFETEVDSIQTALSRISILLEKAECPHAKRKIMGSERFKQDLRKLLREVDGLSDSIKLYNEGFTDTLDERCQ